MVGSMAAFALEDVCIKWVAMTLPISQILVLFGMGGAILFSCVALINRERILQREIISPPMQLRVLFEIFGRLFFVLAIVLTPLSSATVILQATPVFVVAGAAIFFQERVGLQRWLAIAIGLIGVVVVVRPGSDSFSFLSVLAVIGMLGFAGRDLASRAAPASLGASILGLYGFLSIIVAGILFSMWEAKPYVLPDLQTTTLLVGAILIGVVAYAGLMKAMRTGQVSAVTPFRYTRLIFGVALGLLLFGEQPGPLMWMGCLLILSSGLLILKGRGIDAPRPKPD